MKTNIQKKWRISPDKQKQGLHPLHDNRFIVTEDWDEEAGKGEIICAMRDSINQKELARHICDSHNAKISGIDKKFKNGWLHFCDCINFSQSNLDADAIRFMNEIPGEVIKALS